VYILPAVGAERDVLGDGIESVLAHAALIPVVGGSREWFAVLLEAVLEEVGGVADEVFVDGEATGEVRDLETDDFGAGAVTCASVEVELAGGLVGVPYWTKFLVCSSGFGDCHLE
jgi:hypothetical protein